jgi:DNA-directed RNA polymerase specialized sigma24 family protein
MSDAQKAIAQARDEFMILVAPIRPELHRYCARLTGSVVEGEDIVQDTLAKAFYTIGLGTSLPPLRPWLFRIAHNAALDFLTSHGHKHTELRAEMADAVGVDEAIDPLAVPATAETHAGSAPEDAAEAPVLTPEPATTAVAPPVSAPALSEHATGPAASAAATGNSDPLGPSAGTRIGLGASFVAGTGPTVTGGLALAVGVEWDALVIDGEARIELPSPGASAVGTFESMLISFALAPCGRVAPVLLCGVIRGGPLRVSGRAVEDASDVTSLWIGLGARVGFETTVDPHVRLQANAELLSALSQTNVLIGIERIWRTEPVAVSLTAGIVFVL